MKNILPRFLCLATLIFFSGVLKAGNSVDETIYTELRGHASFNAVFLVVAIILAGIFITLLRIERKVARLEKEMKGTKS